MTSRGRRTDGKTLALLAAMYALLLGNFALYWTHPLPIVVHVLVGAVAIHLAFTIWHEAGHRNVSRRRWVNDVVGILGIFPYLTPWYIQRWIHLEHHRQVNLAADPNRIYLDGPFYSIFLRYPRALGYASKLIVRDPRTRREWWIDAGMTLTLVALLALAWWNGVLLDVVLLWILPVAIAKVVMDWYVNYLPHVGLPPGRFEATRIVDVGWLTPLVLLHNYHAIHHLWPHVPWHRYRAVFREKRPYLEAHDVPIEHRVFARRPVAPAVASAR